MFKTFKEYALIKEAASRSYAHLLALAHSDRLMVAISSFRAGRDQPPPRSAADLQRDIRSQMGLEIIPNPECAINPHAAPEITGTKPMATLPNTGKMGFLKAIGGFREKKLDNKGIPVLDDKGQEIHYDVCEDTVVVSHPKENEPSDEEVINFFTKLCQKYRQEAFLFKSPSSPDIHLISQTGEKIHLGQMRPATVIDQFFTKLRAGANRDERRIKAVSDDDVTYNTGV